ncbi:hypothetical protein HZU83_00980 [Sphaerotilus montanus]|jgi:hypothetical protein|uniref:PIN domain-containing protein n=1 Tax=Sphaerotilus montanus TaxID=522889 RepID=A0A7Y9QTS1_9BURK|nr:hypothetical protein [Sphaerotilus montanus]NYG31263.1 hypothetical protein [Sphaerotilus montanus]NZD55249.1 hypothetical protein [Sphaerotilus montanus]
MLRCLLDADALAWLLRLDSDPAHDEHRQAWLAEAQRQRATLLIPAAMLADWLVETGPAGEAAFKALRLARPVEVAAFDERAARELVRLHTFASTTDDDRWSRASREQRQLVALAVVRQAALVGEAPRLDAAAALAGVAFVSMGDIASLGVPPQLSLPLDVQDASAAASVAPLSPLDKGVFSDLAQAFSAFDLLVSDPLSSETPAP